MPPYRQSQTLAVRPTRASLTRRVILRAATRCAAIGFPALAALGADCGSDTTPPLAVGGVPSIILHVSESGHYDQVISIAIDGPKGARAGPSQLSVGFDDKPRRADPLIVTLECPGTEAATLDLNSRYDYRVVAVFDVVDEFPAALQCTLSMQTTPNFKTPFDLEWGVGIEVAIDAALEHQVRIDVTVSPA